MANLSELGSPLSGHRPHGTGWVSLAKSYCDDVDEATAPEGGGSFAEYAMISLNETYEMTIDRLAVTRQFWRVSGLSLKSLTSIDIE